MQRLSRTKATVPVTGGFLAARPVRTTAEPRLVDDEVADDRGRPLHPRRNR